MRHILALFYTKHLQADEEGTPTQTQRRRRDDTPEEDEDVEMEDEDQDTGSGSVEQLSKSLVRYAISCEHSRKPIKRQDINEKGETLHDTALDWTDCVSTGLEYAPVQRCVQPYQCRAHGRLWHAAHGASKGGEGNSAAKARYAISSYMSNMT